MLRLANSSVYSTGNRVTELRRAAVQLGSNVIRNLALGISVAKAVAPGESRGRFNSVLFWQHSVAVATLAQLLARDTGACSPDEIFIAGLLHDVGKTVLNQCMPEEFDAALAAASQHNLPMRIAELQATGLTHIDAGSEVLRAWEIPDPIPLIVTDSHVPWATLIQRHPPHFQQAAIIHLAGFLAKAARMGYGGDNVLDDLPADMLAQLRITPPMLTRALERAEVEVVQLLIVIMGDSVSPEQTRDPLENALRGSGKILLVQDPPCQVDPVEIALRKLNADVTMGSIEEATGTLSKNHHDHAVINLLPTEEVSAKLVPLVTQLLSQQVPTVVLVPKKLSGKAQQVLRDSPIILIEKPFELRILIGALSEQAGTSEDSVTSDKVEEERHAD